VAFLIRSIVAVGSANRPLIHRLIVVGLSRVRRATSRTPTRRTARTIASPSPTITDSLRMCFKV